jgi:hypothetical protein
VLAYAQRGSGGGGGFGWFVVAGDCAGGDGQTVPEIDGADGEGQVYDFLFGELFLQVCVHVVGGVGLRDEGERFCPGEGGALAVGEEGGFAPGFEGVEALLGFSGGTRIDGMHVQAVGASVDLRGSHFYEMKELRV